MDELRVGRKKAVSWYATKRPEDENGTEDEDDTVVRRKISGRYNPAKSKSLEPKQEMLMPEGYSNSTIDLFEMDSDGHSVDWSVGSLAKTFKRSNYRIGKLNTRLLEAVENDDTEETDRLLKLGANPNATCRLNHVSACHMAAMINSDMLSMLIKAGAESIRTDKLGRTPLHLAAWAGNTKQIGILLNFSEELQNRIAFKISEEIILEVKKLSPAVHMLINMPCNIGLLSTIPSPWHDSTEHNCRRIKEKLPVFQPGWTALHSASARAQYTCVDLLLAVGADPCARDLIGRTPLDVAGAAHYSKHTIDVHRETVRLLLAADGKFYGTRLNGINNVNTPLHTAVELESLEAIEELLDAGASATCLNSAGLTAMHICVEKQLREHLQLLANYDYKDQDPYVVTVDAKDSMGLTVLHAAVRAKWANGVCIALGAGANIFMKANDGESPIHSAATTGDMHILQELLTVAKFAIDYPNQKGQTALFIAIIHNHLEIVKMLIENGASLSVTLSDQRNVLHVAARHGHAEILEYILHYGGRAVASLINHWATYTPITYAVLNNFPTCVELLLRKGAQLHEFVIYEDSFNKENGLTTDLHVAAAKNHFEIARIILDFDSEAINKFNTAGLQPLHEACIHGNREIISLFIHKGADLSRVAEHAKMKLTPIEMLINNLSKPAAYLEEVFDSYVSSQGMNLQDRECQVTVNYSILVPNPTDGKQMKVIKALVNTGNRYDQRKLLHHPLVESFLYLKWKALLPFFYAIIVLYALFVLSLNVYIVSVFYYQDKNRQNVPNVIVTNTTGSFNIVYPMKKSVPLYLQPDVWKHMVYVTVSLIALQEIIFITIRNKRYFLFVETWVKFASIVLTLCLSMVSWHGPEIIGDSESSPEWARLIATIALLLSWLELMFLLSRFPSWGFYVLMFGKVATKVLKILATFMFLIIGFSLCFMIQFRAKSPFEGPWAAITKTFVMMTSEYDYVSMINKGQAQHITASILILRLVFIVFVILASIVLMNLLVGVAVNDVNNLEEIGHQKRLEKQVEFLASLEDIVCNKDIRKVLPNKFNSTWSVRKKVKNVIVLRPRQATCTYSRIFPTHIREAIFEKAQLQKKQMDDQLGSMAYHMKLDEIHDAVLNNLYKEEKVDPEHTTNITVFNEAVDKLNKQIEELRKEMSVMRQLISRRYSTNY